MIETTVAEVAAELTRRGIPPDQRIIVSVEPDDWLTRQRAFARPLVQAEGWTDEDIDRIIEEERAAVQQVGLGRRSRAVADITLEEIGQMINARMSTEFDNLNRLLDEDDS